MIEIQDCLLCYQNPRLPLRLTPSSRMAPWQRAPTSRCMRSRRLSSAPARPVLTPRSPDPGPQCPTEKPSPHREFSNHQLNWITPQALLQLKTHKATFFLSITNCSFVDSEPFTTTSPWMTTRSSSARETWFTSWKSVTTDGSLEPHREPESLEPFPGTMSHRSKH